MPTYRGDADYQHGTAQKIGVLITNLGSPDDCKPGAVRRYLAEFLADPRVVEIPRVLWRIILHGVILRVRPSKSARAYAKVWGADGAPLIQISSRQEHGIAQRLKQRHGERVVTALGMRYGNPSIASALEQLRADNVRKILLLPLYPQYSAVTGASTFDAVAKELMRTRWIPELHTVNQYHDEPAYIDALAASVLDHWKQHGKGERLLMSFHGVPQRYLTAGDPYHCQCHKTARLLAAKLELKEEQWTIAFQSRLGREEWLRPYTDDIIEQWAKKGIKRIDAICPGFSADCLETLEEMVMQYGELFNEHGGESLRYVPCLNDTPAHLDFLTRFAEKHLHPWLEGADNQSVESLTRSRERAVKLGASQ